MKAIRINSPGNLEICEVPVPKISNSEDVLIKVKAAGICGSDMHIYHGTNPLATYPRVVGHEFVGEVVEIGEGVTKFQVGDHVIVDPVVRCEECYPCSIGRPNVCQSLRVRGVHVDGGFQEYYVAPQKNVHLIPENLNWEEATLIEPFSISAQVISRGQITGKDTVFVMGAGPIGLCILQAVKRIGAKCIISDLVESRLELAKKFGADITINPLKENVEEVIMEETNGFGVPVIVDAVCIPQSFEQTVRLASSAGRIVILGFAEKPSQIPQLEITKKELDIRGSRLQANKFPEVIEWFRNGEVDPKPLITNVYNFMDVKKAIEQVENNPIETYKVILKFD